MPNVLIDVSAWQFVAMAEIGTLADPFVAAITVFLARDPVLFFSQIVHRMKRFGAALSCHRLGPVVETGSIEGETNVPPRRTLSTAVVRSAAKVRLRTNPFAGVEELSGYGTIIVDAQHQDPHARVRGDQAAHHVHFAVPR